MYLSHSTTDLKLGLCEVNKPFGVQYEEALIQLRK